MADYTYATPSGKTYDEFIKDQEARAAKQSAAYAEKANAQNETYKAATNAIYDKSIKAQEDTAAADTAKTHASYNAQFDANAASQLARERHLKEQMANYGLGGSGYNATNQTALAVSRGNADAKTRTARQQAIDTIDQELRKYKADMESQRAAALAESDRDTATRIMDNDQTLQQNVHSEAMDLINRDDALAEFQWNRDYQTERDAVSDRQWQATFDLSQQELNETVKQNAFNNNMTTKEYVDDHNSTVYGLMLDAYNSGNSALGNEYAKDLWQINENGEVVPMTFDTTAASEFVDEQVALDRQAAAAKAAADTEDLTGYNALGFPKAYESSIENAKKSMDDLMTLVAKDEVSPANSAAVRSQVLGTLYSIISADDNGAQMMSDEDIVRMCTYVGITPAQLENYIYARRNSAKPVSSETQQNVIKPTTK